MAAYAQFWAGRSTAPWQRPGRAVARTIFGLFNVVKFYIFIFYRFGFLLLGLPILN